MEEKENERFPFERKEVIIIGNGPSAIILSYLLAGHIPYWNGCPVSNDYLNMKLEQYVKDTSLLDQDFEFLSDGLEGRSRNPVSLLFDHLIHPDADLGANLQSKLKWRYDPSSAIDHLCLGRTGVGGVWSRIKSKQLQTVSMASWMELPNYSMETFRQQRRARRGGIDASSLPLPLRANYEEVHSYYLHYVKRNRLANNFRNGCQVTSVKQVLVDNDRACKSSLVWQICGFDEISEKPFTLHAKYVVLATGIPQEITRPLGCPGEDVNQSLIYTNLCDIEHLIVNQKRLTSSSKPLLIVGLGMTAIDVILLCQEYSIPIVHVFRRSIDDHELVLNQLSPNLYPEYEPIREYIRQTSSPSYQCYPQHEVISIGDNGTVQLRHLRSHQISEHQISFIARLTGTDIELPFLSISTKKKHPSLPIHPYTYEFLEKENLYGIGALAGDKLVRFLQGGAFACAADLRKKMRQSNEENSCK